MIKWLCTLPLLRQIYRQGGIDSFHHAHKDIWDTMKDDVEKMANDRVHAKLVEMLSPIDWNHVVSQGKGLIFIGNNKADPAQLQALKAEAELLSTLEIWKILQETPNALGQQAMFKTGEDVDAFKKGRAMLFHLDSQKKIVDLLKSYEGSK